MSAELSHRPVSADSKPNHYPGAMGLLVFTLAGPFFGMIGFVLGLTAASVTNNLREACAISAGACGASLLRQLAGIGDWVGANVFMMPFMIPAAYVIGITPAAISGMLFLIARTFLGLSDRRSWQILIGLNLTVFALLWLGSVRINWIYSFQAAHPGDAVLMLWTHVFATFAAGRLTGLLNRNAGQGTPA
jgi:hypothetical protein